MIILDSQLGAYRITTIQFRTWKPLWAELLTYRRCARNASSDRAIPTDKILDDRIYVPLKVGKPHTGMMPTEYLEGYDLLQFHEVIMELYQMTLTKLEPYKDKVAKSILNRYFSPFTEYNCIMTGEERHWKHLFKQRCSPTWGGNGDAEPNLQRLCDRIAEEYYASQPVQRSSHVPFLSGDEEERLSDEEKWLVSAARCARISYTPHGETKKNLEKDLELANRLMSSGHLSPFEHIVLPKEGFRLAWDSRVVGYVTASPLTQTEEFRVGCKC